MRYIILLLISLLFVSCSDEQIINPILFPIDEATIGVKSKTYYPSLESNQILSIEDFAYNNRGQLQKKIYYGGNKEILYNYELFNYDKDGKLIYKLDYHSNSNSPTGFILLDSTNYSYNGNVLVTEKITYPLADYFVQYIFEYNGKYLSKKTKFHNNNLESYSTYKYEEGKIQREVTYHIDDSIIESKEYKYKDVSLIEVVYYTSKDEAKRRIIYSYNKNGKLILENVDELLIYSSSLPCVVKYEY